MVVIKARRLFYFCGAFASRLLRSPLENRTEHRPIRDSLEFEECRGYETSTGMILARFETTNTKFIAPTANPRNTETSPAQTSGAISYAISDTISRLFRGRGIIPKDIPSGRSELDLPRRRAKGDLACKE